MDLVSSEVAEKIMWMQIRISSAIVMITGAVLLVYRDMTRPVLAHKWRVLILLPVPFLLLILTWTNPSLQLFRYDYFIEQIGGLNVLKWKNGPVYWVVILYSDVILGITSYHLARSFQSARHKTRLGVVFIILALLLPLVIDFAFNLGYSPLRGINLTPFILIISMGILFYAFIRFRWQGIVPLARSTLVDMMPAGVLVLDAQRRIIDINPAALNQLSITERVHGKILEQALSQVQPQPIQQIDFSKKQHEIHVLQPDGKLGFYELEITPLKGKIDNFDGMVIVIQDITDRKNKEIRLLQLTQGVDQSPTSIVITNLKGEIEYVNPNFTLLTGFTPAEALGQNANIVSSGQTQDKIYKEMWGVISAGQTWHGEFLNKKKNGELYWEKAVIAPIKDRDGHIINFIAIKEDITIQKAAEEALRHSEAELRLVNTELEQRLSKIEALEKELRELAVRDPLTGLFNRRFLNESIDREIIRSQRAGEPLSVILMDIDHFKMINDMHGHQAGDAFLQIVANRLQNKARRSDMICRYGGEEFLLVLPGVPLEAAARRAEDLRNSISMTSMTHHGVEIGTTISAGVASFPSSGNTASELLKAADEALYTSKNLGRNLITVWENKE
jgi:diguanylate cyclase (GGDEF)-like protein/PAS domain S-box-containing protein